MQSVNVAVLSANSDGSGDSMLTPPPSLAELPLIVQPVSVITACLLLSRPPPPLAELPLMVQSVSIAVP